MCLNRAVTRPVPLIFVGVVIIDPPLLDRKKAFVVIFFVNEKMLYEVVQLLADSLNWYGELISDIVSKMSETLYFSVKPTLNQFLLTGNIYDHSLLPIARRNARFLATPRKRFILEKKCINAKK